MESIQNLILQSLDRNGEIKDTLQFDKVDQLVLRGVLSSLERKEILAFSPIDREVWALTREGQSLAEHGSHEAKFFNSVPLEGIEIKALQGVLGEAYAFGQGKAFKNKWVEKNGSIIKKAVPSIIDQTSLDLNLVKENGILKDATILKDLSKRKLIEKQKSTSYSVTKAAKFTLIVVKEEADITAEMMQSGEWKNAQFKKYNFNAKGSVPESGHLHPLMKVREEFRQIFFALG